MARLDWNGMTAAGKFRHWLTFERLVTSEDSDGALQEDWVDAFETNTRMPCEVQTLSGRELIAAQAVQSRVSARVIVRYRPGFDPAMRATGSDGTVYNIEGVAPDSESRRRYVTLYCSTGLNAGGTAT